MILKWNFLPHYDSISCICIIRNYFWALFWMHFWPSNDGRRWIKSFMDAPFYSFADHMPKMQEAIRWQDSSNSKATALWSPTGNWQAILAFRRALRGTLRLQQFTNTGVYWQIHIFIMKQPLKYVLWVLNRKFFIYLLHLRS